ncbi:MAG: choice-of-anchor V domain-containing protein [Acidobacteriota bacterium]
MKKIKLICVSLSIVFAIICASTGGQRNAMANSGILPNGFTGAASEPTCATIGCHSGALDTGDGLLEINIDGLKEDGTYEAGATYTVTVRATPGSLPRSRWGFQLTALTADGLRAGTLENIEDEEGNSLTSILDDSGPTGERQYIQHDTDGTFRGETQGAMWSFRWKADQNVGPVTFYIAGLMANNNGRSTGDEVYTKNRVVLSEPPQPPVIAEISVSGKKLIVTGENFDDGADIYLNDEKQKTKNDGDNPTTRLIAKKAGKKIDPGQTVMIKVKNTNGLESEVKEFMRPPE